MFVIGLLFSLALTIDAFDLDVTVEPRWNSTEPQASAVLETALAVVTEPTTTALGHLRAKRQWGGFGCCAPIPPPMPMCCQPMLPPPIPPPCCMPVIPPPIVSCCGCCMPVCMPMCMRGGCGMGGCGMGFGFGRKKRALIAMRPNDALKHFLRLLWTQTALNHRCVLANPVPAWLGQLGASKTKKATQTAAGLRRPPGVDTPRRRLRSPRGAKTFPDGYLKVRRGLRTFIPIAVTPQRSNLRNAMKMDALRLLFAALLVLASVSAEDEKKPDSLESSTKALGERLSSLKAALVRRKRQCCSVCPTGNCGCGGCPPPPPPMCAPQCMPACQPQCLQIAVQQQCPQQCFPMCTQACVQQFQVVIQPPPMVQQCAPQCMPACQPQCVQQIQVIQVRPQATCVPACMPSCQPQCLQSVQVQVQQTCMPQCMPACQPMCIQQIQVPVVQQQCVQACMPACQPQCVQTVIPTCQPSCMPSCTPTCMQQQTTVIIQQPVMQQQCAPACMPSCQPQCVQMQMCNSCSSNCPSACGPRPVCAPQCMPSCQPQCVQQIQVIVQQPVVQQCAPACMPACQPQCVQQIVATCPQQCRPACAPACVQQIQIQAVQIQMPTCAPQCMPSCQPQCVQQIQIPVIQQQCVQACMPACQPQCIQQIQVPVIQQCAPQCMPACQPQCNAAFVVPSAPTMQLTIQCGDPCQCQPGYVQCAPQTCCLRYKNMATKFSKKAKKMHHAPVEASDDPSALLNNDAIADDEAIDFARLRAEVDAAQIEERNKRSD
ncbi:hypothetical protein QR680_018135 [Steinernema hermaphroditum]|uniref:Uncharacterized protein n=1 Tax=Steinernema hermaphroditum TaxID=289476 RepID=A0AA39HJ74_9BILA|nr:hypothetical protein QR680_018135 [Steinernema hermaphroditum]